VSPDEPRPDEPRRVTVSRRAIRAGAWAVLSLAGLSAWAWFALGPEGHRAWRAFLVNFLYFTPLAGGMAVWPAILLSSNAGWTEPVERAASRALAFAVPSVAALGVLWIGSPAWAPWYGKGLKSGWLDNTFLFSRDVVVLAAFWLLAWRHVARRRHGDVLVPAGAAVIAYCVAFTMIGMDLAMALSPEWYSSLFGGYFFISGLYAGVTAWTFVLAWRPGLNPDRLHDLGKLVLTFAILTTYMFYCQLLPIWYENLPREILFVVPRRNLPPWSWVSAGIVVAVLLGPLVLLLTAWSKRTRWYLGSVCLLLLAGLWVERWWLVEPAFSQELRYGLVEVAATAAFLGIFGLGLDLFARGAEAAAPPEVEGP
jgi:hypothetical protein